MAVISRDGRSLAVRDEDSGTTKVMRLHDDGECSELLDLMVATGKVSFDNSGLRIAFAIVPEDTQTSVTSAPALVVLTLADSSVLRIPLPEQTVGLSFTDFLGEDRIAVITRDSSGDASLDVVCCLSADRARGTSTSDATQSIPGDGLTVR